jgi:uncharacterized protein
MIFNGIIVKLASSCNLNCRYCYWFRDSEVYRKPRLLGLDVEDAFLHKLSAHLARYDLRRFSIEFHGGEPLLFGKQRFAGLCRRLNDLGTASGASIGLGVTTNGVLVDAEWAGLFQDLGVWVTLSIDGSARIHDRNRVGFAGEGTHAQVIDGLNMLRARGIEPGVLAFCDPATDPAEVLDALVNDLGITRLDILLPDATHDDSPPSVAAYGKKLFTLWYEHYSRRGIEISLPEEIARGLLGLRSRTEGIGYGPITTLTLMTDGGLEPLDVLRIAGHNFTKTVFNIKDHDLQDAQRDPLWQEVRRASLELPAVCRACPFLLPCGGGYLPTRWSRAGRFDNPSVYCDDLKAVFRHAWALISRDLRIEDRAEVLASPTLLPPGQQSGLCNESMQES